jgi:glycosyltransferase involved in cell wall biosynthesis
MRIVAVHNLSPGGAHRRLGEQLARLAAAFDIVEVCLAGARPLTAGAEVVPFAPVAPRLPAALRIPWRYHDLGRLLMAWRTAARFARAQRPAALLASPCRFLQAPPLLAERIAPSLYFCDEPRRVDHDPSAMGSRRRLTRPVYAPLYRIERRADERAVAAASRIATNSAFTAGEIASAYGRPAEVVPMGVAEAFRGARGAPAGHVLSVGSLIPAKGHDLVLAGVALARRRRPVVIVAPRAEPPEAARLQALAASSGVELTLRFGIEDGELAALYAGAHATVYMAAREPFGLVSLEAQAAGSPVIVAAEGGLPETLPPGRERWAVPRRAPAVATRLDDLEEPAERARAVECGRRHAEGLTWERSARRIGEMLSELAGGR